jgi:ribosomal protein L11 methylase PrmA
VANITADIHIRLLSDYKRLSSSWILSGISDYRKGQMDLFLNIEGIVPTETWEKDGWYTYYITI